MEEVSHGFESVMPGLYGVYEIDHCTAFRPCSARNITPSSLLVCGEQ